MSLSTWSVSAAITHWLCDWQDLSLQGFLYFPHLPSSCLLWTQFFGKSIQVPGLSEFGYLNQWFRIHQKLPILYFHTLLCIFLWMVRFFKIKVTQHFQIFISPPTSLSNYIHDCGCLVNMFNFFFLIVDVFLFRCICITF